MEKSIFHRLSGVLWVIIVTLIVLLAVYVSLGRLLTANLSALQGAILQELNARVPFTVEADRVGGEWFSFTPIIVLNGLRLSVPDSDQAPLELSAGRVGVDVFHSLRTRSLQLTRLVLDDLNLRGELTAQGRLRLRGFEGEREIGKWLQEFLLNVELVGLRNTRLELTLPSGEIRNLEVALRLTREGSHRRVEANLVSSRGARIFALAEGVGNPFTPRLFSGELYLDVESDDLGAVRDMLARAPRAAWADGNLDVELWFAWERGKPSLQTRVEARDLRVADPEQTWNVPLDRVAFEARLLERKNRWTLFTENLEIEREGVIAALPRVQLDAWGRALRLRTEAVPLAPFNAIAAGIVGLPPVLEELLRELQPRGTLSALQLSIGDIDAPGSDWDVTANFDEIAVDSWRGAPGITSASGYMELDRQGGFVLLDSRDLAMAFPAIYREPLRYDDISGTVYLDWGERAMRLTSGLITAEGEEGTAQALFGLNIPLTRSPVGLELELLVGLQNAHPIHRVKYVPDVLNEGLRGWLDRSIGEGQVDQGAFLWRGTLKRKTAHLRTVQLAFNVSETSLDYDPRWPPVTVSEGIIFIDDTDVSVWSERARLYQSEVRQLSAETWMERPGQLMLAVSAELQGPASDGLAVINGSPINDIVGGAFSDWTAEGDLEIGLDLQLNINDRSAPPRVDVRTRWRDVDLLIRPGKLPLQSVTGDFAFSSARGFSSGDLSGTLWGKPLAASVRQREEGDPASAVEVSIDTRADMADVRQWLQLAPLAFAEGETAADVAIVATRGAPPLMHLESSLAGVSLDLPSPWRKEADTERALQLELPLGGERTVLKLDLEGDLQLQLDITGGGVRGGAMAVAADAEAPEPGVLYLSGHAPLVQGDEWERFIRQYFYTGTPGEAPAEDAEERALAIRIDGLLADELVIWDRSLRDVRFSLAVERDAWDLSAETDWLRAEFLQPAGDAVAQLEIDDLDLAVVDSLSRREDGETGEDAAVGEVGEVVEVDEVVEVVEVDEVGEDEADSVDGEPAAQAPDILDLPDMDVAVRGLRHGEREVGTLTFGLRSEAELLSAINITGELAGMQLPETQPGQLLWQQGDGGHSALKARLSFGDLGQVLAYFGYEKILVTEKGRFDFDLRWPGAPQDFSLAQAEGSTQVHIEEGSFLEAPSGATGALRVVSILNLADIVSRLSLSHMFESGIPFDKVKGEVFLHRGVIEVAGMDVDGPSSFHFSGVSDVAERSLEGELVATFPVANNLPWVAALTASLPIAAGVYLVSKVFQNPLDRLSSAVYSISGSWDDPEVKFAHIFDDSSQRAQGQTADAREVAGDEVGSDPDQTAVPEDPQQSAPGPDRAADPEDPQEPMPTAPEPVSPGSDRVPDPQDVLPEIEPGSRALAADSPGGAQSPSP